MGELCSVYLLWCSMALCYVKRLWFENIFFNIEILSFQILQKCILLICVFVILWTPKPIWPSISGSSSRSPDEDTRWTWKIQTSKVALFQRKRSRDFQDQKRYDKPTGWFNTWSLRLGPQLPENVTLHRFSDCVKPLTLVSVCIIKLSHFLVENSIISISANVKFKAQ